METAEIGTFEHLSFCSISSVHNITIQLSRKSISQCFIFTLSTATIACYYATLNCSDSFNWPAYFSVISVKLFYSSDKQNSSSGHPSIKGHLLTTRRIYLKSKAARRKW